MVENEILFVPLDESHFEWVCYWFNLPHIQAFYSLRSWTSEEVRDKLTPYLNGEKGLKAFIIYFKNEPIGYIQSYPVKEHPWDGQDLPANVVFEAAGFDLFIGQTDTLRKGLGSKIINRFLEKHIWPHYRYCLADPDVRNEASLRLFQKCGFSKHKQVSILNPLKQMTTLQLFIKER